jgi:hypothetical protein
MFVSNKKHYFTQDRSTAINQWLLQPDECNFMGIYDTGDVNDYEFKQNDIGNLQNIINEALNNQNIKPMVWMLNREVLSPQYINASPIQRKIYDVANLMVYKKHLEITKLNPYCKLVRIKTDMLSYIDIKQDIETDDEKWGEVKIQLSQSKPGEIWDIDKYNRKELYKLKEKEWVNHKREVLDDDDIKSIIEFGGLIFGMAGVSKSTALRQIRDTLQQNNNLVSAVYT